MMRSIFKDELTRSNGMIYKQQTCTYLSFSLSLSLSLSLPLYLSLSLSLSLSLNKCCYSWRVERERGRKKERDREREREREGVDIYCGSRKQLSISVCLLMILLVFVFAARIPASNTTDTNGEVFRDQGTFADGQSSPYTSELSFTSQPADHGDYSCIAVLEDSSVSPEISTSLPITVISTQMVPAADPLYLVAGVSFPVSCTFPNLASSSLAITWTMGSSPSDITDLDISNFYTESEGAGGTKTGISFKAKTTDMYSTNYTCKGVYKNVGTGEELVVTDTKRIEIRGFKNQPQSVNVAIGSSTSFTCGAVGEQQAIVTWTVGDVDQDTSLYTTSHSSRLTSSTLTLRNLNTTSSLVQCHMTFSNNSTLSSSTATLRVIGIGFVTEPQHRGFVKGEDYEMTCIVRREEGISTTVTWYQGYSAMPSERYSKTEQDDTYISLLYFTDVANNANGDYTCIVMYLIDGKQTTMTSAIASVYVREITLYPTTYKVSRSPTDSYTFYCTYEGDFEAGSGVESLTCQVVLERFIQLSIRWANGVNVDGLSGFEATLSKQTSSWTGKLIASDIQPELAGQIECRFHCGVGGSISGKLQERDSCQFRAAIYGMVRLTFYRVPKHISRSNLKFKTQLPTTDTTNTLMYIVKWFVSKLNSLILCRSSPAVSDTVDYVQYNRLSVSGWTVAKDPVTLTCRYRYDTTGETASYNTQLLFKGTIISRFRIIVGDRSCPHETKPCLSYLQGLQVVYRSMFTMSPAPSLSTAHSGSPTVPLDPREYRGLKMGNRCLHLVTVQYNYRYEVAVREETGNWEASLSLNGTFSDTISTDSGSYTCQFQFSSGESYNQTTQLQFYSKLMW
eukprot:sb/3462038/